MLDLTPLAIIVTAIGTVWTHADRGWKQLARRALITSLSACGPLPLVVLSVLTLRFGHELFSWDSLPFLVGELLVWSLVVALPSWLLGLGLVFLFFRKNKNSFRGDATIV